MVRFHHTSLVVNKRQASLFRLTISWRAIRALPKAGAPSAVNSKVIWVRHLIALRRRRIRENMAFPLQAVGGCHQINAQADEPYGFVDFDH